MYQSQTNSWRFERGIVTTFLFIQMVDGMEILLLVVQFLHQTPSFLCVCLIRHPSSLPKCGQSLKPWNRLKSRHHYLCRLHIWKHPLLVMVIRKCVPVIFTNKECFYVGYPTVGIRGKENVCSGFVSFQDWCILNIQSTTIFILLGKMIGMKTGE